MSFQNGEVCLRLHGDPCYVRRHSQYQSLVRHHGCPLSHMSQCQWHLFDGLDCHSRRLGEFGCHIRLTIYSVY